MIEPRSSAGCRHVRAAGGLRLPAFVRLVLLTSGLSVFSWPCSSYLSSLPAVVISARSKVLIEESTAVSLKNTWRGI